MTDNDLICLDWTSLVGTQSKNLTNFTSVCQVECEGETKTVEDNFDLASPLLETSVDGNTETLQLIKRGAAGEIRIR